MTDREQKINEMAKLVEEHSCDDVCCYCKYSGLKNCERLHDMETLYNAGYRKMDEVTLRLDLGDRSAEEIAQIAEAFNKAMATEQTLITVPDERKADKEIPQKVTHEATILADCTCPRCGNVVSKVEEWGNSKIRTITEYCPFCGQHLKGDDE